MSEFGPNVSRLQTSVQGLQEEAETYQRAAGELQQRRDTLQRQVDDADQDLVQRRAAITQFQFKLKSQGLLVEDCERRAKEAEQENDSVRAELTKIREAIAAEKRNRLERLDSIDGRVQSLVRQFRDAAALTHDDPGRQDDQTESARRRVGELRQTVDQLASQLEADQQSHVVQPEVKTATLIEAQEVVDGLKEQLGL
ncbi:myosin-11-like [Pollicipes pollicipes]|uniref:myosin-11-like n=1 Tax=Pollicipes pollicipes TaxID=41117 RepID=UPI00188535AB|nr:myosin-11-like [Pollicipes pollicipes]XP_037085342.1 myosin-11-like [Pollicipes pollicipes]